MPTNVGGSQAFVTERVTEGTFLPVGANLASSFIGVEIQGDTTPYKIDISSLSGRLNITQTVIGVIKPKGKGAYSVATQYTLMDYVDSGNQHYLYIGDTPSTGTPLTDTTKWTPLLTDGVNGTNGTNGTNGVNAYTTTSAAFTVPAINSSVTISVVNSAWMVSGQTIFIATAGTYTIASVISATSISATNTGASGNAAAAVTISSGSAVSPGGRNGTNGTNGISAIATTNAFTQPAINANVTVTVNSSAGFVDKQPLFHDLGGYYIVSGAPPSATTVTLKNLGYAGNIAASASVGAGTLVPSGIKGLDGSGGGGAVGLKFTLNTTAGAPTAGEIRSTNLAGGGTIAVNPVDTQANATDILGALKIGAIVNIGKDNANWVRGTVTTAWTTLSGSFAIGDVRAAGAIANAETVYLSIASDAPIPGSGSTIRVREADGAPNDLVTDIIVPNGSLAISAGVATLQFASAIGREILTATRNYYVRTDGSDANNGLTNTAGGAWLTLGRAAQEIGRLDTLIYDVNVNTGAGTFTGNVSWTNILGSGVVNIIGGGIGSTFIVGNLIWNVQGRYTVDAFKISNASGPCISVDSGDITIKTIDYGASGNVHNQVTLNGILRPSQNYTISGGAAAHFAAYDLGKIAANPTAPRTITVTGSPAFPAGFAIAQRQGAILAVDQNYSGAATGPRKSISQGGSCIVVGGAGSGSANYFPGDSAGTVDTATFGIYG